MCAERKNRHGVDEPGYRSWVMSRIHAEGTVPEMVVRRLVHSMGYGYRLHDRGLPGKPDLVFRGRRKVIWVHGCFWHGHDCARGARTPKTNTTYWEEKIRRNQARDELAAIRIFARGWNYLVIWECETRDLAKLAQRIQAFLEHQANGVTTKGEKGVLLP